ncbi:hypothetical protein BJF92_07475 [Rhizobium rhizosphaerae]|uniref:Uncharacterized protein n=1 Tax=Xaviernesmea rhizosphaerae TaxID=1672749 RepID=A0A1Q9AD19_9HYPH|nr:hypothetical protein [Xaviernesmea rhizosphaerae]OLP52812.1 hypothetical protein BJF92_07475 [Xaviernesmea rhizosphaerae]
MDISGRIEGPEADKVRDALKDMLGRLERDGVSRAKASALIRAELERDAMSDQPESAPPSPDAPMREEPANDWPAA